jgi:DNA-binding transcriptional MerR regulator
MTESVVQGFPIRRAAKLSGLKPAMVDYLCRQQILVPAIRGQRGRGCPRQYSFGDVVMLRVLARLLQAGVSVSRLKVALKSIRRFHKMISETALPAQYLVTDGRNVYLRDRDTLRDLDGSGQTSFLFVLELGHVQREVLRAVSKG